MPFNVLNVPAKIDARLSLRYHPDGTALAAASLSSAADSDADTWLTILLTRYKPTTNQALHYD